jgi:hypothetical protein
MSLTARSALASAARPKPVTARSCASRQFARQVKSTEIAAQADQTSRLQGVVQNRRGVPQFQMPHGLLLQGLRCLNHIFPGFEERLVAAGGVRVDWGLECDFRDFQVRSYTQGFYITSQDFPRQM